MDTDTPSILVFNSHPHKEDDRSQIFNSAGTAFFNSHPHKEDDMNPRDYEEAMKFSTHILTRRMTHLRVVCLRLLSFQLTSSQGG